LRFIRAANVVGPSNSKQQNQVADYKSESVFNWNTVAIVSLYLYPVLYVMP